MAKPEWGIKRICQSCGTLFYDFHKSPIICPKCETEFDPEAVLKSRRNRVPVVDETKKKAELQKLSRDEEPDDVVDQGGADGDDEQAIVEEDGDDDSDNDADSDGNGEDLIPDGAENGDANNLDSGHEEDSLLDEEEDD